MSKKLTDIDISINEVSEDKADMTVGVDTPTVTPIKEKTLIGFETVRDGQGKVISSKPIYK